jgi:4-hydroxybenzoate polyprenyltransferase
MHFLRLIRPVNLAVIALTMYAVRVFVETALGKHSTIPNAEERMDFRLLVFSTLLIAAAGNIINDYFDVRADRINKPEKLIITTHVKPRWAIVSHWAFNFLAFAIAAYLSYKYSTLWYLFIHLLTINALWFYSMYFKRRFLIGNLIIAAMTALVPILAGIFFYIELKLAPPNPLLPRGLFGPEWMLDLLKGGKMIYALAAFAFALNFVREIVKDMQDVPGDLVLRARTLPIVLGAQATRWTAIGLLLAMLAAGIAVSLNWGAELADPLKTAFAPALIVIASCLAAIAFLLSSLEKRSLKRADLFLKIAMVAGCSMPYYWYFLV